MNSRYESFALRLWVTGRGIAHGEIVRTADGKRSRFRSPDEIAVFIERCLEQNWASEGAPAHSGASVEGHRTQGE
jgi:hypothetical protein